MTERKERVDGRQQHRIGRLVTALITPCIEGKVRPEAITALVDYQAENGTEGLFILGTAGQGPFLVEEERKVLAEATVTAAKGRLAVVCHVGATTTEVSVRLACHAEAIGVTAIAAVPPIYYSPDEKTVLEYYSTLIDAVSVPVYAYDNPAATGYSFGARQLAELVAAGLAGVKVARSDLLFVQALVQAEVPTWIANAHLNAAALWAGAEGSVSTITNLSPRLFQSLQISFRERDIESSRQVQQRIDKFSTAVRTPIIGGLHYGVTRLGLPGGTPRPPLRMPDDEERAVIELAMKEERLL